MRANERIAEAKAKAKGAPEVEGGFRIGIRAQGQDVRAMTMNPMDAVESIRPFAKAFVGIRFPLWHAQDEPDLRELLPSPPAEQPAEPIRKKKSKSK